MLKKLLIANRGEIAVRVARSSRDADIRTVGLFTPEERHALHREMCDEAAELTGGPRGYLDRALVVRTAMEAGCDSIHPGYGYLAEDAEFARMVGDAGLVFVGPPPEVIELAGDKVSARAAATDCGVPVPAATDGYVTEPEQVVRFGESCGWPVLLKAAHGGGGRGMRLVESPHAAATALRECRDEARLAFGADAVFGEQYLTGTRHVEVQILADTHGGVLVAGDRECSVQRRNQKLIEEAPAPALTDDLRGGIADAAERLARAIGYVGAGTVEFLIAGDRFYFLEINARIQVEHPVTEEVHGLDIVREQLRIASGERLSVDRTEARGHAIEVRINAESVALGFVPSTGALDALTIPHLPGLRFDTGYRAGDAVTGAFDSLVGKLIVRAADRGTCIERLTAALAGTTISGVDTTAPLARSILGHEDFLSSRVTTAWLQQRLDRGELDLQPHDSVSPTGRVPGADDDHDVVTVAGEPVLVPVLRRDRRGADPREQRREKGRRNHRLTGSVIGPGGRADAAEHVVTSPTAGSIATVLTAVGAHVREGDQLVVLEAMKMLVPIVAPADGRVAELKVTEGSAVRLAEPVLVLDVSRPGTEPAPSRDELEGDKAR